MATGQRQVWRGRRRLQPGASKCGRQDSQAPPAVLSASAGRRQASLSCARWERLAAILKSTTPTLACERSAWIAVVLKRATLRSPRCLTTVLRSRRPGGCATVSATISGGGGVPGGARAHPHRTIRARTTPVPCARHAPCQRVSCAVVYGYTRYNTARDYGE
jgi:hypothetical protein